MENAFYFGGIEMTRLDPWLSDIQLCVLALGRLATCVLQNSKKGSACKKSADQRNDNHGIE